jgi:hypothetical protein
MVFKIGKFEYEEISEEEANKLIEYYKVWCIYDEGVTIYFKRVK